jgi:hypothetical protein
MMFIHQISWVVLKFQWQKFEQNRKAKALQPVDYCCTRSPPGRSGSALTYSCLNKKLSYRAGGGAQVIEHLPSKCEALSSIPSTTKKKKKPDKTLL